MVVVVAFRFSTAPETGEQISNNFVVTAWGSASVDESL